MKKRRALVLTMLLILALAGWFSWSGGSGEAGDIRNLADLVASKQDAAVKTRAEELARKYKDLGPLMSLFKERTAKGGGLGVAKKAGSIQPDGIEKKIRSLAQGGASEAELQEHDEDLVRMAQITAAIAAVTKHKCEVRQKTGYLDPEDFVRWSEDMQQSARELADAVRARDSAQVTAVAGVLWSICTRCHHIFRD
jgi:hypothetical protein